jgi:hypothetical protein
MSAENSETPQRRRLALRGRHRGRNRPDAEPLGLLLPNGAGLSFATRGGGATRPRNLERGALNCPGSGRSPAGETGSPVTDWRYRGGRFRSTGLRFPGSEVQPQSPRIESPGSAYQSRSSAGEFRGSGIQFRGSAFGFRSAALQSPSSETKSRSLALQPQNVAVPLLSTGFNVRNPLPTSRLALGEAALIIECQQLPSATDHGLLTTGF